MSLHIKLDRRKSFVVDGVSFGRTICLPDQWRIGGVSETFCYSVQWRIQIIQSKILFLSSCGDLLFLLWSMCVIVLVSDRNSCLPLSHESCPISDGYMLLTQRRRSVSIGRNHSRMIVCVWKEGWAWPGRYGNLKTKGFAMKLQVDTRRVTFFFFFFKKECRNVN